MRTRSVWLHLCAFALLLVVPGILGAQDDGAPANARAGFRPPDRVTQGLQRDEPASLRRLVTVRRIRVPLRDVLQEINRQARLRLMYAADVAPLDRKVTIDVANVPAREALERALAGLAVDVVVLPTGEITLRKRAPKPARQDGTLTGRVSDAKSGEGLTGAQVLLEELGWYAATGEDGRYWLAGVTVGKHTLVVRRIGYRPRTQVVTVVDGRETTVDVALEPVPTQLDEVVTTVTGEQRLRELGHVVGRINADSLVKEAPVSSLSELLTGRVAGVQVSQTQGTVGGEVTLQVRGQNSRSLSNAPIVVVDGVRYAANAISGLSFVSPARVEPTSPLNDINPNDIESIEVVKGPSAATLYGTDAANGVIVITTKRGRAGPTRWNGYVRASRTSMPTLDFSEPRARAYGTTSSGTVTSFCPLFNVASGACTQDSIVVLPNPLSDPELTIFGHQPMWETGLNVSGGREDVRYYFSASFQDLTGPVQMPDALLERLEEARGADIPDEWRKPNTRTNLNLRSSVTARLGGTAELSAQAGYIRAATRSFPRDNPYTSAMMLVASPTDPYGSYEPNDVFAGQSTERTDRFVGGATVQWRPAAWLQTRGALGLDLGGRNRYSLVRTGDAPGLVASGAVADDRARQVAATADLGMTATARRGRFSSRTSVGAQYVRNLTDLLTSSGTGLPPGGSSVAQAASRSTGQSYNETVTLGGYLEEMVGFNDRLFLTGALRVDGASAFGQNFEAAMYPKVSGSWIASEEPFFPRLPGLDELRLRYAYGASGQQPRPFMARPTYNVAQGFINDAPQTVMRLMELGNPDLQPERVREHELGFDASGLANRVQLGLTWYRRRTDDLIISLPIATGYGSRYTNIGLVEQHGFEAELSARVVDARLVSLDVVTWHALSRTKIVDLGGAPSFRSIHGGGAVEGYSFGARFQPAIAYGDANGDGLLTRSDVQVPPSSEWSYAGESVPPISQALTAVIGLFEHRVRISAMLERRAGFAQDNKLKTRQCANSSCMEMMDPATPLAVQAQAIAARNGEAAFLEPGDYTRLREVTVVLDLPTPVVRTFGGRSATVSLSGRNLALWSRFSGPDVESMLRPSFTDPGGIPQGRTWTLRFDVGI